MKKELLEELEHSMFSNFFELYLKANFAYQENDHKKRLQALISILEIMNEIFGQYQELNELTITK